MSASASAFTRRRLLAVSGAAGVAILLPDGVRVADAASRKKVPLARGGGFSSGVMSGDPAPDAVTLWTRLDDVQEAGRARLRLEIARDEGFSKVVLRRDVPVTALRDWTAKVRVSGLDPDERYWFRFATRSSSSPVGRTQTAPAKDSKRPLTIGYFACQDYASGFYGAYQAMLARDPDVVVCGGDYIYERVFRESGYGNARKDTIGKDGDGTARTLADYRAKYRLYRTDPDLQELQRLTPLVAQWDDHEVSDNYAGGAERNPYAEEPFDTWDRDRMLAGWRAWHEHMPALRFGRSLRQFRDLQLGALAHLHVLDSRSYRDPQPCEDSSLAPCGETGAKRSYLGREQLTWLQDGLASSPAAWQVVLNQLMVMPFDVLPTLPVTVDSWEGYAAERGELLRSIEQRRVDDVVFLTGDIHTFFGGEVRRDGRTGPAVATELVGGSTTSPGTAELLQNQVSQGLLSADVLKGITDTAVPALNPWMRYAETRSHGCMVLEVREKEVRADVLGSRDVLTHAGSRDVRTLERLRIPRGRARVEVG
ncbi:alkaline phosphatase [Conexibacter sp. SYSU D00693]|uniref:alkaline phosphatase D family protein n=1 Tax=Conexibacter sp. SYSU D00693 TaxID=2812560 RepID=UPI00196A96CE|nr:alkaline phosphatase D family protein [Conexibacter sp. SYSU D00693]